jgi:hypothetical protein
MQVISFISLKYEYLWVINKFIIHKKCEIIININKMNFF